MFTEGSTLRGGPKEHFRKRLAAGFAICFPGFSDTHEQRPSAWEVMSSPALLDLNPPGPGRGWGLPTHRFLGYLLGSCWNGTWRSPVAHRNGVAGVPGSNPGVPINGSLTSVGEPFFHCR